MTLAHCGSDKEDVCDIHAGEKENKEGERKKPILERRPRPQRMIPQNVFNEMLPRAAAWAQQQEQLVLRHQQALTLTESGQEVARRAGVAHPEAVRILGVPAIPRPEQTDLRAAAVSLGLITPSTAGLTIGHGIFVRHGSLNDAKLIAHELKHVAQYERHGSISGFLQQYLSEVNQYGYPASPMEQEAVAFAESVFPSQSHRQQ